MAYLGDDEDAIVEESMRAFENLGDLSQLFENGYFTVMQCAFLTAALKSGGDLNLMADHYTTLVSIDIANGKLNPRHPETFLPYSEYLYMLKAGVYGEDGDSMPIATTNWLLPLEEVEEWLKSKSIHINFQALKNDIAKVRKFQEETLKSDANLIEKSWKENARKFALEYIERHRQNNLFPSQKDTCAHVETELRKHKIYGAHGKPVSANYIERNAIRGEWWKQNKP